MSIEKINQSENYFSRILSLHKDMNGAEFCRFVGISTPLYQKWKNGAVPGYDKLKLVAEKFNVSVEWLLTGKEGVAIQVPGGIRDMVIKGMGATGTNAHELAELMKVSPAEVDAALKGNNQNLAFTEKYNKHVQPIIDMRKKGVCPNCVKEIDRLNKIIDKLVSK